MTTLLLIVTAIVLFWVGVKAAGFAASQSSNVMGFASAIIFVTAIYTSVKVF